MGWPAWRPAPAPDLPGGADLRAGEGVQGPLARPHCAPAPGRRAGNPAAARKTPNFWVTKMQTDDLAELVLFGLPHLPA